MKNLLKDFDCGKFDDENMWNQNMSNKTTNHEKSRKTKTAWK